MNRKRRFAVVGTGGRASMFIEAITATYRDSCELTALCDLNQTRMDWHNQQIQSQAGMVPVPAYHPDQFDSMIPTRIPIR
jgi:predicted dehydrogenase